MFVQLKNEVMSYTLLIHGSDRVTGSAVGSTRRVPKQAYSCMFSHITFSYHLPESIDDNVHVLHRYKNVYAVLSLLQNRIEFRSFDVFIVG